MNIKYNNNIKERFIPISYSKLCKDTLTYLKCDNNLDYIKFSEFLSKYYYENTYDDLKIIKTNYLPFSPDEDVLSDIFTKEELKSKEEDLFLKIDDILNNANYEVLTKQMLEKAIEQTSLYGVEVSINFDDFKEVKIYFRGQSIKTDNILDPMKLYLKKKEISFPIYRRLLLVIKPKTLETRASEIAKEKNISQEEAIKQLKDNDILIKDNTQNNIYIKLFKNIPQIDLEMLFPNTKIKMKFFDKLKIAIFGGGGTVSGALTLSAKLGSISVNPMSSLVALGAFAGVLWRQVKGVLYKKSQYMAQLAQKLYFYNLANNMSALIQCVENSKEEQKKETFLAYIFLANENEAISKEDLDKKIEKFIDSYYDMKVNFEINDGLEELNKMGLLVQANSKLSIKNKTL
jgi:hypothetical protein